jgi:hypothetical protein
MLHALRHWFSIVCLILALTGCAGPVPKVDLAPAAMSSVKTIAVIRVPEPTQYSVMNFGHPGMALGIIGGAVVAGDMSAKQQKLTQVYKDNKVAVGAELSKLVAERLNAVGYQAHVEDQVWKRVNGKEMLELKDIKSNADAVILITPTVLGYVATGLTGGYGNDYLPTLAVVVNVLGPDRKKLLYRGYHASGWELKAEGWHNTKPKARFANFDMIIDNPTASAAALSDAAVAIVDSLIADMRAQKGLPMAPTDTTVIAPLQRQ